jgi:hypothetical protein
VDIVDYLIKILTIAFVSIAGLSWLIFFTIKTLSKYTDFGKHKKEQEKKEHKTFSSKDDVPVLKKDGPDEFFYEMPKIETSFGNSRIGEVYEHPKKT